MTSIRVFLVDDHLVVREGIRRLLEWDERIAVVGEAGSGEEALEQIHVCSAEVVLMDIRLTGIDGIESTRRLRAQYPDLKVIVLSAFGDEYLANAIEAGAKGYIMKTATQPELVHAVVEAAAGRSPIDSGLTSRLLDRLVELSTTSRSESLSSRQHEILQLIADGVPSNEIAARVSISDTTLTRTLRQIFNLLGVDNRTHAVAEAYKRKLL